MRGKKKDGKKKTVGNIQDFVSREILIYLNGYEVHNKAEKDVVTIKGDLKRHSLVLLHCFSVRKAYKAINK